MVRKGIHLLIAMVGLLVCCLQTLAQFPPPTPSLQINDKLVYEDGSGSPTMNMTSNAGATVQTTITLSGIPSGWGVVANGGSYDSSTGVWSITLPAGTTSYSGAPTLSPPAHSDVDITSLIAVATNTSLSNGLTSQNSRTAKVVVDAAADVPSLVADNAIAVLNSAAPMSISATLVDTDGSETITGYQISSVPAGFSFSAGSDLGGGVWSFTPAQIGGAQLNAPSGFVGEINLTAKVFNTETPVTDIDFDNFNNDGQASASFSVSWVPEPSTTSVLALGLLSLCARGRSRRK